MVECMEKVVYLVGKSHSRSGHSASIFHTTMVIVKTKLELTHSILMNFPLSFIEKTAD